MRLQKLTLHVICCLSFIFPSYAQEIQGFWKTISDETNQPQSIVGIYEYQGKYYGRIIATYDDKGKIDATLDSPNGRAPGVEGEPFYTGLDIIWGLKPQDSKYLDGKILDPEKGRVYDAEMWRKDGNLIVRGKVWIFGANQEWLPAGPTDFPPGFTPPDMTQFVPQIPKAKKEHRKRTTTRSKASDNKEEQLKKEQE